MFILITIFDLNFGYIVFSKYLFKFDRDKKIQVWGFEVKIFKLKVLQQWFYSDFNQQLVLRLLTQLFFKCGNLTYPLNVEGAKK